MIRKETMKNSSLAIYISLFGMAIVTHFFAFLCIKQSDTDHLELTGFDLIFGKEFIDSIGFQTNYPPDLWLGIAFFLAVSGLTFSLLRFPGYEIHVLLVSLGAFVCLALFFVKIEYRNTSRTSYLFSMAYWLQVVIFGILVFISLAKRLIDAKSKKNISESKILYINIITKNSQNSQDI